MTPPLVILYSSSENPRQRTYLSTTTSCVILNSFQNPTFLQLPSRPKLIGWGCGWSDFTEGGTASHEAAVPPLSRF